MNFPCMGILPARNQYYSPRASGVQATLIRALMVILWLARPLSAADVFVDVTARAGIDVVHVNGTSGDRLLPETMIGGAGWFDYDGDGRLDLYVVQGHRQPRMIGGLGDVSNRLFRNVDGRRFVDVTEKAGVGDSRYGCGLAVGDVDNDGDPDLYVTNCGRNTLYVNNGDGSFRDMTDAAGVSCPLWSGSAAFFDANSDGLLDLYVANYVYYDAKTQKACKGENGLPSYCHPNKFVGAPDSLFINRGNLRFEDVSKSSSVAVSGAILSKGLGVLPTDFDQDGDVDMFVANDSVPNFLWRNLGKGKFEDAGLEAGVSLNLNGSNEACMGVDGADVNGDGWIDYFVTNFSKETDTLYLSEGDGFFEDATFRARLGQHTFLPLGFGTKFLDFDLDGDFDIYVARGHVLDNAEQLNPESGIRFAQEDQLFENDGKGVFKDVSASSGKWFKQKLVGRAAAFADYDNDGDLDAFIVNLGQRCVLLENRAANLTKHHWIGLSVKTGQPTRDAYGAFLQVVTANGVVVGEVRSAASYLSANDPRFLVGTGQSSAPIKEVRVRWTDGSEERFTNLEVDRYHTIQRGKGVR